MQARFVAVVGCMLMVLVSVASADTMIATDLSAGAALNASGGSFTGSITFTNTSSVDQGLVAFSLQLLNGSGVISNLSVTGLPSGWEFFDGKQNNSGAPCNETGNPNWFCADGFTSGSLPFTMASIPADGSITFNFGGNYTSTPLTTGNLDLMADGCSTTAFTTDQQGTVNCTDTKWAYSNIIGAPPATPPSVPEPSSMLLLGTGLTSVAAFARRKFRK